MLNIMESEPNNPFKIKGIAMKKDILSKNGWYYSNDLIEKTVSVIKESIERNGSYPITMMADHPTIISNKTLSVIGKITDIYVDGSNAVIEAEIANTSVGKDVQELIRGRFVEGLSIRASNAKFQKKYIGAVLVKDVLEMDLKGVDLVVSPSVDGARITDIIESDNSKDSNNIYIEITESEEVKNPQDDEIDEEEKTLDLNELKTKFPELVESLKKEHKTIFESENQHAELQESYDALVLEKGNLETKITESDTKIKDFETKIQESETKLKDTETKLQEAETKLTSIEEEAKKAKKDAHIASELAKLKFADSVKEKLKAKLEVLESTEEITSVLESEVDFLNDVIKASTGVDVKGKGNVGDNKSKDDKISEEEAFINLVNEM